MAISVKAFGTLPDGRTADLYTLTNAGGASVSITNYGGILVSIVVPDRDGKPGDVLLGCKTVTDYLPNDGYLGALIGRIGNRVNRGHCVLNGREIQLNCNSGAHHLHGGNSGFNEKLWEAEALDAENALKLRCFSPDGEENYPGNLSVTVTYSWNDQNELGIHYQAVSDQDTMVNLTNHAYFNIDGEGAGVIDDQIITIRADAFTPTDETLIPTGEIRDVSGTVFDLRKPTRLGDGLAKTQQDDQLRAGGGYDQNFCLNGEGYREVASVYSPATGRVLTVLTDQPGIQLYTGNSLGGNMPGKCGHCYGKREALCLETQTYPDAINHANFPGCVLRAGETYDHLTTYRFSVQ